MIRMITTTEKKKSDVRIRSVRLHTARHGSHAALHTARQVSVVMVMTWLIIVTVGEATTDTPRKASSPYRQARLRADRT